MVALYCVLALAASGGVQAQQGAALKQFLMRYEPAFAVKLVKRERNALEATMVSQEWKGKPWTHDLAIDLPSTGFTGTAFLIVTGDRSDNVDRPFARSLALNARMAVATVYQVPNQPLYERTEDDLIAYTFQQYLQTQDPDWPALFPMVKAAKQAMVAVQRLSNGKVKRFIVTGASKRGWITWLLGASGDPRVAGIAPMIYDNLNIEAQLEHQVASWGGYSEMLSPYTDQNLPDLVQTPEAQKLLAMIDPYAYREKLTVPKLVITASNDRYWTADALSQYWDALPGPKAVHTVVNKGHTNLPEAVPVMAAFAQAVAAKTPFGSVSTRWPMALPTPSKNAVPNGFVEVQALGATDATLWYAESDSLDFRESSWRPGPRQHAKGRYRLPIPDSRRSLALMVRAKFKGYELNSPIKVYPARRGTPNAGRGS